MIQYLKEQGAYYPVHLNAEDIASITITNYHNEIYENEILDEKSNKPIKDKTIYGIIYHCPNCRNEIDTENKYCPYCKSLLNWSEIE